MITNPRNLFAKSDEPQLSQTFDVTTRRHFLQTLSAAGTGLGLLLYDFSPGGLP
ncbi:MAG: twin-arginine translocation signal domain-containing protein [Nitrososphaeria archaeon]